MLRNGPALMQLPEPCQAPQGPGETASHSDPHLLLVEPKAPRAQLPDLVDAADEAAHTICIAKAGVEQRMSRSARARKPVRPRMPASFCADGSMPAVAISLLPRLELLPLPRLDPFLLS